MGKNKLFLILSLPVFFVVFFLLLFLYLLLHSSLMKVSGCYLQVN